jgi:hypothetical protein
MILLFAQGVNNPDASLPLALAQEAPLAQPQEQVALGRPPQVALQVARQAHAPQPQPLAQVKHFENEPT